MANPHYNTQIRTLKEPTSGQGAANLGGTPTQSVLNMSVPNRGGLPGPEQPNDRSNGIPECKRYAQAIGIEGGASEQEGSTINGPGSNNLKGAPLIRRK